MKSWTRFLPVVLVAVIAICTGTLAANVPNEKAAYYSQSSEEKEYSALQKRLEQGEDLNDWDKARLKQLTERFGAPRDCFNPLDNQGGPDAFGYYFVDNQGGDTASYEWIELRGDAEATWISTWISYDDGMSTNPVTIGFNFPFYGSTYSTFKPSSNGQIEFGPTYSASYYYNCLSATTNWGPAIMPYLYDMHLQRGGDPTGNNVVGYKNFGTYMVIEYDSLGYYSCTGASVKFEVILYDNGKVKLQYNNIANLGTCNMGTVGMVRGTTEANMFLQYRCQTEGNTVRPITNGLAIWFFQPNGIPNPVSNLQGSVNGNNVTLTWTDPTQDINGNAIVVDSVQVWMGEPDTGTRLGAVGPGVQTFTQANAPQGNNLYSVRPYNDGYDGAYVSVNVIVGNPSYAEDFETSDGGWVSDGGWEWGVPTSGPGAAHSGANLWGTVLAGNYANSACYNLTLSLGSAVESPTATVEFWRWYDTEAGFDGCNFKVSTDQGTTWTLVVPLGDYNDTTYSANICIPLQPVWSGRTGNAWTYVVLPIGQFIGEVPEFRFTFGSDASVQYPGFYFDDMTIWGLGAASGGTITGTVTDDNSGDPIPGITVAIIELGATRTTNAQGMYNFSYVPPATYTLNFSGGLYDPLTIPNVVVTDGQTTTVNALLHSSFLTYPYTGNPVPITDNDSSFAVINVPDDFEPTGVQVLINSITHTYDGDLSIWVRSPNGTTVNLSLTNGGSGDNYINTLFDDAAQTLISAGTAPFTGTFRPEGVLASVLGASALGDWTLVVYDGAGGDVGTIDSWTLILGGTIGPQGTLAGMVRTLSNNQPLANAWVVAVGEDSTQTDAQGNYSLDLPATTYTVRFRHAGYCDSVRTGVLIEDGQTTIMNVSLRAPVANMSVSSITHQGVQGEITSTTFSIDNTGNCDLSYSITDDQTWLSELPASGTIAGSGSQEITVWFDATNLGIGEYNGTMTITHSATGSPVTIPVQLIIPNAAGDAGETLPTEFALNGNYPNPFNAVTEIRYDLPQNARVSLVLYNMLGQEVRHLVNNDVPAGRHTAVWDGRNNSGGGMTSGIYLVRLVAGEHTFTGKVMLLK